MLELMMQIVELGLLDLQKEHNISRAMRNHLDIIIAFFGIAVILSFGYSSYIPVIPFIVLLMVYVIADDNESQVMETNDVKLNHALKQNNWFEAVRNNAYKWVDGE